MANDSYAVRAVANGPMTAAPPSFDGQGWLVVINLTIMTTVAILATMLAAKLIKDWLRFRPAEGWPTPTAVYRAVGILGCIAIALACGIEAVSLWGWNPLDPERTAGFLTAKRLIDPIARCFTFAWIALYTLVEPAMIEQLRKDDEPPSMWPKLHLLYRPAMITLSTFAAAVAVVSLR